MPALGALIMIARKPFCRTILLAAALVLTTAFLASPARADRCDDIAKHLASQIDGLKVGITAANFIYLSHPAAKELSLGCRGRNYSNEIFAKGDRKPRKEFLELVASAAAITFTLPKDDMMTGAKRCLSRMGLLRGDKVKLTYRRLNFECTRTKTDASIAISRGLDQ